MGVSTLLIILPGPYPIPYPIPPLPTQTEFHLRDAEQKYLEQLLFNDELAEALMTPPQLKVTSSAPTKSHASHVTASAELQHCLELAPDVPLLGLQEDHLKAVLADTRNEVGVVVGVVCKRTMYHLLGTGNEVGGVWPTGGPLKVGGGVACRRTT
jgi:hypothetical protein